MKLQYFNKGESTNHSVLSSIQMYLFLQIGLAVGDIDSIRKTAAMERYTSQVIH